MLSTIIGLDDESFSFALRFDAKEESVLHTISATFTNMRKLVQSRDSCRSISGKARTRSVSYVRLRLWLQNKRFTW
ncbi:MAG: hypothetical protein DMF13_09330 [Verrucomicrobia bacterium]|nr:MAG: hypothetical protein DMF13_09330 [Verrucomicrobiota bacterium]